jgi:hypothetical protein
MSRLGRRKIKQYQIANAIIERCRQSSFRVTCVFPAIRKLFCDKQSSSCYLSRCYFQFMLKRLKKREDLTAGAWTASQSRQLWDLTR